MAKEIIIALAAGGVGTSLIEYFLKYNLIDKIVDLFRSTETKVAAAELKLKTLKAKL